MKTVHKIFLTLSVLFALSFAACVAREGSQTTSATIEAAASTMTLQAEHSTENESLLGKTSLQVLSVSLLPGFASPTVLATFTAMQDTAPIEVGSFFVCELVFDDGTSPEKLDAILSPGQSPDSAGQFQVRFPAAFVNRGAHVRVLLTGSAKTADGWQPFDMATFESQVLSMTN